MTTPRDDIAGLSEGLRAPRMGDPAELACQLDDLALEAATQLDALSADRDMIRIRMEELEHERDALSARVKELEAELVDTRNALVDVVKQRGGLESRALRAEQEHDEASRMNHIETEKLEDRIEVLQLRFDNLTRLVGGVVIELGCTADSEAVFEAITKLKQERDEAYERLAAMNGMSPDEWAREKAIAHAAMTPEIEDAIRRLASGPEKEKKE